MLNCLATTSSFNNFKASIEYYTFKNYSFLFKKQYFDVLFASHLRESINFIAFSYSNGASGYVQYFVVTGEYSGVSSLVEVSFLLKLFSSLYESQTSRMLLSSEFRNIKSNLWILPKLLIGNKNFLVAHDTIKYSCRVVNLFGD